MAALSFEGVVKRFADLVAVDHLSFQVPEGGVFGFLGGNGAGKTTSLRMALDILHPDAGVIEVLGRPPGRDQAREIGFLPEERGLYRQMTVLDTIVYFGRLKGLPAREARAIATRLVDRFELGPWAGKKVAKLSKGLQQKVQVATALVNAPRLLILDEPFSGLDPVNQAALEEVVLEAARGGATVIFSTHVMQHAERLCDRLILLANGRPVFEGTVGAARATLPARLRLTTRADPRTLPAVAAARADEAGADGWTAWDVDLQPGVAAGDLLEACTAGGFPLRAFDVARPTLHEVFLYLVGGPEEAAR